MAETFPVQKNWPAADVSMWPEGARLRDHGDALCHNFCYHEQAWDLKSAFARNIRYQILHITWPDRGI